MENDFLKLLLDTAQSIILVLNPDGTINSFNPYMERVSGYQLEEVQGKDWFETFLPNQDWQKIRGLFKKAINDMEIIGNINPIVIKDGSEVSIEWYAKTLKDHNGKVLGLLSIGQDITERILTEEALKQSERKYRVLLENIPLKIFHKDTNSVYVSCNKNYARDLNVDSDKIIGTTDYDYHPKELAEKYIHDDRRVIESGKSEDIVENYIIDGQEYWVHTVKTSLKNDDGQVTGVLGVFRDITDMKRMEDEKERLEAQLRQAHKMEAIGTLAGGIAHDFNNILAAMLGYAEMAKDDIPDWSSANYQLEEVLKAGNRAKKLVKQILAFSRKADQNRAPVQIHLLIKEIYHFLRATIPSNIEIKLDIDPLCGSILADPTQIHQVLMNLCTNAVQAMEEDDGTLSITLNECTLESDSLETHTVQKPGPHIMLSVKDTGIGINKEYLDRIFDPYFTTKEVGKGSGMGLAVVHGIVRSHKGLITVESCPGQETTFNLFFPAIEDAVDEQTKVDHSPVPVGRENILIVDDDASIATLTQKRLEKLGYQATAMTDSVETIEKFKGDPNVYDLVITDQAMPKMTGEQLAKELLKIRPDIPIMICTGYSSTIDADKAHAIGIKAFLMKPVEYKELAKTVRQVLDSSGLYGYFQSKDL